MKEKIQKYEVLGLVIIAAILGSGITTLSKVGLKSMTPISFSLLRFAFAGLVLAPLFVKERVKFNLSRAKSLIFVSLLMTANVTLFIFGVRLTTAIVSQTLYAAVPLITAIITYFILKERLNPKKEIGLMVGFFGVLLIIFLPLIGKNMNNGSLVGNLIVFSAVIAFSFYSVLSKNLQKDFTPVTITFSFILLTILIQSCLLPFDQASFGSFSHLTALGLFAAFYVGAIGTGVTYLIYQFTIKKASPVTASLTMYLQPVFSIIWASILLGERLTVGFAVGAILALLGVFIATN